MQSNTLETQTGHKRTMETWW